MLTFVVTIIAFPLYLLDSTYYSNNRFAFVTRFGALFHNYQCIRRAHSQLNKMFLLVLFNTFIDYKKTIKLNIIVLSRIFLLSTSSGWLVSATLDDSTTCISPAVIAPFFIPLFAGSGKISAFIGWCSCILPELLLSTLILWLITCT